MNDTKDSQDAVIVPVIVEQLRIDKREVVTGGVRVRKQVVERAEIVDEPLSVVRLQVEHVAVGRFVDELPLVREEGDVTIVPVVEEVAVVEKRLWLREEVRITRHRTESRAPQTVTLRHEEVTIENLSAAEAVEQQAEQQQRADGTRNAEGSADRNAPLRQRDGHEQ